VPRDASRMDRIRGVLERQGVRRCVAFVIGEEAERDLEPLARWLASGYELGNHTYDHMRAGAVTTDAFVKSILRCHALLEEVGAFGAGRRAWFRFPFLDYGAGPEQGARIDAALHGLGYEIAHASADFCDDRFEAAAARVSRSHQGELGRLIAWRYALTATGALDEASHRLACVHGRAVPLVAYFHFGQVSDLFLARALEHIRGGGASFCSLEEALSDPAYGELCEGSFRTGLVSDALRATSLERLRRRAQRCANRLDPTQGCLLGPPWPLVR
jgi:peptidoglycan/xylan/chitin deacetylase (PgdA/CDA1 family)